MSPELPSGPGLHCFSDFQLVSVIVGVRHDKSVILPYIELYRNVYLK